MTRVFKYIGTPLLLLIIIIPSIYTLFRPGYFPMHDDIQAFRLLEMDKCINDGQIPCRWIPDMGYGYGYPQFNYYGPFPYYLMEVVHSVGFGFLDSVKIGFILSVVFSGVGMYLLGKSLWGKWGGLISAALYVYAPYRAVNVYVRGSMGEAGGTAFLPFIFWSTLGVVKQKKYSELWLALSLFGLFTSHNITALIFIPFYAAWIILLLSQEKRDYKMLFQRVKSIFVASLWGFLMSAFFTLPAFFERSYVHIETLLMGYFNYLAHYVGIGQLLFSTKFEYGVSELGTNDSMLLSPGILLWLLPIVTILLLWLFKKKKYIAQVGVITLLGWISLFMIHPRSVVIWDKISILTFVQFPWRFLTIASLFFALAGGAIAIILPKKTLGVIILSLILFITVFVNVSYFKPKEILNITDADKFSGEAWQKQLTISIFDYLPIYAEYPPTEKAPDEPIFINGEGEVIAGQKGTNWQTWKLDVLSESASIIFPLYDFPKWSATVDGEINEIFHDNELGLINLRLNSGIQEVKLKLQDTPIRRVSNAITLISFLLIPIYLVKLKKS